MAQSVPGYSRITVDPEVLSGKPCVRGLRLSVEQVLHALAAFPDWADLSRNYPSLEEADIPEVLRFAASCMGGDFHPLDLTAAK
jgi:uncharacterized protein (DUF433 family)